MKKLIFLLTAFVLFTEVHSQDYTVIHVIGEIIDIESNKPLVRGTKLQENSKLQFKNQDSRAAVLSSDRGRFILQPNTMEGEEDDLSYLLATVIRPVRGKMSSRSGVALSSFNFTSEFTKPTAWISDTIIYNAPEDLFPLGDKGLFFVRYRYNGEEVNKKLLSEGQNFYFVKSTFFSVDDQPVSPDSISDMQLYYFDTQDKASRQLSDLSLNSVETEELKGIYESMKSENKEVSMEEFYYLVKDLFGECNREELAQIIE